MDDLVAFVNARLDEDEAQWRESAGYRGAGCSLPGLHLEPERAARNLVADRKLIAMWEEQDDYNLPEDMGEGRDPDERAADELIKGVLREVLQVRAAVYSDHPDYRAGWKP